MPPPSSMPKRVYKDLRNCIGLLSQRNYKQSETEFKKFIKNHSEYKECLLAKTLTLYFDIFHHNRQDFDEDLMQLIESTKTIGKADDDSMAPFLIIDIFNHIKRRDKSAEVCKIYCERYGGKELYKYYFEYLIQLFDFNEQSKVAMKMYQLDKESEPNKFQLCCATFLQAASKPTPKERELGFEFAAKLAQKLFADNSEFLEGYLKSVEEAKIRYAEKPFLDENGYVLDLGGDENAVMEASKNKEKLNEVETEVKLECFKTSFVALKEGPRTEKLWHETLGFLPDTNADHPKTEAYSTLASFFQELQQQSPQLSKEDLFACIEFLNAAEPEDYGIGTFGERVNEYIERFGHDFHEYQNILPYFHSLSDVEEQKKIIENSNKILEILKPYLGKKSEIGVESVVIDARDEIIEPKDVEALGSANIPTGILEIIMGYYHRVFLTDQMKLLSGEIETISELEKMIDNWMKIVNTLDNQDIILDARVVTCQEFSEHIINAIFTVLFETYAANEPHTGHCIPHIDLFVPSVRIHASNGSFIKQLDVRLSNGKIVSYFIEPASIDQYFSSVTNSFSSLNLSAEKFPDTNRRGALFRIPNIFQLNGIRLFEVSHNSLNKHQSISLPVRPLSFIMADATQTHPFKSIATYYSNLSNTMSTDDSNEHIQALYQQEKDLPPKCLFNWFINRYEDDLGCVWYLRKSLSTQMALFSLIQYTFDLNQMSLENLYFDMSFGKLFNVSQTFSERSSPVPFRLTPAFTEFFDLSINGHFIPTMVSLAQAFLRKRFEDYFRPFYWDFWVRSCQKQGKRMTATEINEFDNRMNTFKQRLSEIANYNGDSDSTIFKLCNDSQSIEKRSILSADLYPWF